MIVHLSARRNLEAQIWGLFHSFITDWCGYDLSLALTAEATGLPSKLRAGGARQKVCSFEVEALRPRRYSTVTLLARLRG